MHKQKRKYVETNEGTSAAGKLLSFALWMDEHCCIHHFHIYTATLLIKHTFQFSAFAKVCHPVYTLFSTITLPHTTSLLASALQIKCMQYLVNDPSSPVAYAKVSIFTPISTVQHMHCFFLLASTSERLFCGLTSMTSFNHK